MIDPRTKAVDAVHGFTLIEVLVAMVLMILICLGVAPLFAMAVAGARVARFQTFATILAAARLEQLRSLTFAYEVRPSMTPIERTDITTNLSGEFATPDGPGLLESPAGTLDANVPPYVDYIDGKGAWVGTGPSPDPHAVFIRRWAVHRDPTDPERSLTLQVLVVAVADEEARRAGPRVLTGREALLVTTVSRKARR